MARRSADVHATLNPPSPALTNPDLILPFDGILGLPVSPPRKQPPSPPDSDQTLGSWSHGPQQLNYSMPLRASPSRNGLGTPLSSIAELDTTPKRTIYAHRSSETLRSSPTLKNTAMPRLKPSWEPKHERRWSNGSGSVHSDDIENMHWPDFEGPSEADEESVALADEEELLGDLPKIADSDDPAGDDGYLSVHSLEDDPLSRRADMILANAKKRLHVSTLCYLCDQYRARLIFKSQAMEGNLRGARNSLLLSAPSSPSSGYFSHLNEKERPRYPTATGVYGHKTRGYNTSGVFNPNATHNRMLSDASSVHDIQTARTLAIPKRSSSALGSFARGLSSLEKSASLRGVRSQQDMRDSRLQSWIEESSMQPEQPRPASQQADLPHARSPSTETFGRPGSAAGSLRFQMDELKGRINSLKARAHEDRAKRLSTSSSRAPSPYVASEKWSEPEAKGHLLSADTGASRPPSRSPRSPRFGNEILPAQTKKGSSSSDDDSGSSRSVRTVERTPPKYAESTYEDAEEALDNIREEVEESDEPSTPSTTVPSFEQKVLMGPQNPTLEELGYTQRYQSNSDETHDAIVDNHYDRDHSPDTASVAGQSEYFEAVPDLAVRHEDREDAFDYENFFLHSAMGTYRRDSTSSGSSVETTRPASPHKRPPTVLETSSPPGNVKTGFATLVQPAPGFHRRSQSVESISTVATFQTAAEGEDDEDEGEDFEDGPDPLEQFLAPAVGSLPQSPPSPSRALLAPPQQHHHHGLMEQHELAASLVSALFDIEATGSKGVPAQDVALVEGVLTNLQRVVRGLREQGDEMDKRTWRRRLDVARRALEVDD